MTERIKSDDLDFFNPLSNRSKFLVFLNDYSKLSKKDLYDKYCKYVSSVSSVSNFSPNTSNTSNNLTANSAWVLLQREIDKKHIFTDKSGVITLYYLSEKGKMEVLKLWETYYKEKEKSKVIEDRKSETDKVTNCFLNYFSSPEVQEQVNNNISQDKFFIEIDFKKFAEQDFEVAELLLERPKEILDIANLFLNIRENPFDTDENLSIKVSNLPESESITINKIRSKHFGKFISVIGEIVSRSTTQAQVETVTYECVQCGSTVKMQQVTEKMAEPKVCSSCRYRGKFDVLSEEFVDCLKIVVSDINENILGTEVKEEIPVLLQKDIYDYHDIKEGDKVKLTVTPNKIHQYMGSSKSTKVIKTLDCYGLSKLNDNYSLAEITDDDRKEFKNISSDPFGHISRHIFRGIKGLEVQKKVSLLGLFSELNIISLGDPGCGKSLIASRCTKVAIRGKHADCINASSSGIVGAVTKNEFTGRYTLDRGVLRPCHPGGLVALDEINRDKSENLQGVILGVMSERRLKINKANVDIDEECNVNIIACVNPLRGSFQYKEPYEVFNILQPLWDRFDVKIYYNDKPDLNDEFFIKEILNSDPDSFEIDSNIILIKKYLLEAQKIEVNLAEDNTRLSVEAKKILPIIFPGDASYRNLKVFKKLIVGMCKLHHVTNPTPEFYSELNDLLLNIKKEEALYLKKYGEKL